MNTMALDAYTSYNSKTFVLPLAIKPLYIDWHRHIALPSKRTICLLIFNSWCNAVICSDF